MKTSFAFLLATVVLSTPSLGIAAPLDCPDAPAVFGAGGASEAKLGNISGQIGNAGHDDNEIDNTLRSVSDALHKDYPAASDADVADIMITAYCSWLAQGEEQNDRSEREVTNFEQRVYQIVFQGPPPREYKTQDWLTGN